MVDLHTQASPRPRSVAVLLWVAVAVFIGMSLPIGLHSDDVGIMEVVSRSSWAEVWTTPFKGLFYRPITVSLAKLSREAFGATAVPLHVLQGMLIVGTVGLFVAVTRARHRPMTRAVGTLYLLASPMTFVSVSPFAVGVADTLVAIAFLLSVASTTHTRFETRGWLLLLPLSLFALLCKESGLLVPAFVALALGLRRRLPRPRLSSRSRWDTSRSAAKLVQSHDVAFATGFGTELLAREELIARFHDQWATSTDTTCSPT